VGDCIAPRQIAEVVFDGHRLAREIDEPDPHVPKPYLRERRLVAPARALTESVR
jgi:dimethylamine/trimethylamine dehydrogenase